VVNYIWIQQSVYTPPVNHPPLSIHSLDKPFDTKVEFSYLERIEL